MRAARTWIDWPLLLGDMLKGQRLQRPNGTCMTSSDKRCQKGFACGVAFVVGALCCKKALPLQGLPDPRGGSGVAASLRPRAEQRKDGLPRSVM